MATYSEVTPDVLAVANRVITRHHPDLLDAKVGFIFQDEASKKDDKYVLGSATKVTDKQRSVGLDLDFIVTVAMDMWQELDQNQREALIDHELCHCDFRMGYARMRGHDFEEFACIVERYGLWKPDLVKLGEILNPQQGFLPGLEPLRSMGAVLAVDPQFAEETA